MASADSWGAAVALPRPRRAVDHAVPRDLATVAWLLAAPCAAVTALLVITLAPPLSHVLYPAQPSFPLLPNVDHRPEPVEGARYVLALLGPLLLVGAVAWLGPRLRIVRRTAVTLAATVQVVVLAVVAASLVK